VWQSCRTEYPANWLSARAGLRHPSRAHRAGGAERPWRCWHAPRSWPTIRQTHKARMHLRSRSRSATSPRRPL
jgi:hypothetical protein